jgi:hypothetical protein
MGTASTRARAVVSRVPRMKGSRPNWWSFGFQVFWTIHENPRVEKAGRAWTIREMTNQATTPTKMATTAASSSR